MRPYDVVVTFQQAKRGSPPILDRRARPRSPDAKNRRDMWQKQGIQGGAGSDDRKLIEVTGSRFDRLSPIAGRRHPLGRLQPVRTHREDQPG